MWEILKDDVVKTVGGDELVCSERLKVPGGWILRSRIGAEGNDGVAIHQIFIKDENHCWGKK